jgi:hypothetical protein
VTADRALAREVRWPAVGLLAAFLVSGAFTRNPRELGLSATGCVVAIAAASIASAVVFAALRPDRLERAVLQVGG